MQLAGLSLAPLGSASGPLTVSITDSGVTGTASPGPYRFAVAGTANQAEVWFRAYTGASNGLFGTSTLVSELGPFSGRSFNASGPVPWWGDPASPYAITLAAQIIPLGSGLSLTSVSAQLAPVPLPAAGLLFGIGLIGLLGVVGRSGGAPAR